MPQKRTLSLTLTLSALALTAASPALAVTAEELWAEWQAQSTAMGQVLAAEAVTPGAGSLTLTGFTSTYSDGEVATVGRIDEVVMTENADGTVAITMSDTYAFSITFTPDPSDPPVTVGVNLVAPDLAITASGETGARVYTYAAPRITIEDGPISGGDGNPPTIDFLIGIEDLAATYQLDSSDPANLGYSSTSSFAGLSGAADILPPAGVQGHMKLSFAFGATEGSGGGRLGNFAEIAANPGMRPAGFDLNADLSYDSARLELTFEDPAQGFQLFASNAGGSFAMSFDESRIEYRVAAEGAATHFTGPGMPVPLEFSVASADLGFSFPLAPGAEPQAMSARVAYIDVMPSAAIWAMGDPSGTIPRDPVSMVIDLSGSVMVMADLLQMDPTMMMGGPPGELREVTLNELRLSAGGASLTGSGSATFAPGPFPMPVGTVDLQLTGGMGLLDVLQASEMLPLEQVALARGLLGAYARPGAAPDTLETNVVMAEGGAITLNGVPFPPGQ